MNSLAGEPADPRTPDTVRTSRAYDEHEEAVIAEVLLRVAQTAAALSPSARPRRRLELLMEWDSECEEDPVPTLRGEQLRQRGIGSQRRARR